MSDPSNDALELFRLCGAEMKILPNGQVPASATHHICSTVPSMNNVNGKGTCADCGIDVYFIDRYNQLPKMCVPCAIKLAKQGNLKSFGNEDGLRKAALHFYRQN